MAEILDSAATGPAPRPASDHRYGSRLPSLTGLRFVAAFVVFGFHLSIAHLVGGGPGAVIRWLFAPGAIGVSFFFLLSGFVLTWSARRDDTVPRFWRRRVAKIYPNHVATWLPALGIALATGEALAPVAILANLALVQSWIPDQRVYYGLNTVSWSLACEIFFYLLFPLLYRGMARIPGRALWPAAAGALGAVWVVPLVAHLLPAADRYWAIWVFPPARLPEFVAGMLLARIVAEGRWPRVGIWPATVLTVAAYLTSRWVPDDFRMVAFTVVPLAVLIASVGAADAAGAPTPWRSRTAVWLGEVSYAFYLTHQLVLRAVAKVVGQPDGIAVGVAAALAALAVTVLVSWLLYRFVEVPGMRVLGPRRRLPAGALRQS